MAKIIRNPISCVVTETDGTHSCRADYGVESEEVKERRSIPREGLVFTLTPQTINDIHEQTIAAINAAEGTTGEPEPDEPEEPEPE